MTLVTAAPHAPAGEGLAGAWGYCLDLENLIVAAACGMDIEAHLGRLQ